MAKIQSSATALTTVLLATSGTYFLVPNKSFAQDQNTPLVAPNLNQAIANPVLPQDKALTPYQLSENEKSILRSAIIAPERIDKNRDFYRHPYETLEFFGIKANSKVIEIWPGQGWYSTILAEYLKQGGGEFVAAQFDTSTTNSPLVKEVVDNYSRAFAANPSKFGTVGVVPFGPRSKELGPKDSADAVLTFRNIHNWLSQGWAEKAFDDFFKVLKPGGVLGIEEHRAGEDSPQDPIAADGYVRQDYVIDLAKEAGFVFIGASEINANSKDTKDHPFGVWTLPPVGRTAPQGKPPNPNFDQTKFKEIGESDRMTLLFMKPYPPPPKMASAKDKTAKVSNPLKVIFGAKPDPVIPSAPKVPEAKEAPSNVKIVFEPVKVAYTPPTKTTTPILPTSEPQIKTETPKAENVDFGSTKSPPALPDFTIPTWGEKTEVKKEVKPNSKVTVKEQNPKPVKIEPVQTKPKTEAKKQVVKANTPDKNIKIAAPKPKQETSSKKLETKSKTAPKPLPPKANGNSKKPIDSKTADKKSVATKTTVTKSSSKAPAKPAAKPPAKKDPNIPDWNVKSKKKN